MMGSSESHVIITFTLANSDLFDAATIAPMMKHFQNLLTAIVAKPEQPVSQSHQTAFIRV
ncbi:hypothetical protein [Nostoc sp.]|uniref:hypothetical protein n=1 Tax=Nostoc sp. TaxID=1180 RepID=UPI002FFD27DC